MASPRARPGSASGAASRPTAGSPDSDYARLGFGAWALLHAMPYNVAGEREFDQYRAAARAIVDLYPCDECRAAARADADVQRLLAALDAMRWPGAPAAARDRLKLWAYALHVAVGRHAGGADRARWRALDPARSPDPGAEARLLRALDRAWDPRYDDSRHAGARRADADAPATRRARSAAEPAAPRLRL